MDIDFDFDLYELGLEVEEVFGFPVDANDIAGLTTADHLLDYVLAHRFRGNQEVCLTGMAFYKLRRALMAVLQIPREGVQVSTPLATIIPKQRRRTWRAIEQAAGLRLPLLRRPRWFTRLAAAVAIGLGIALPVLLGLKPFRGGVLSAIVSAVVIALIFASRLTECFATEFPPDLSTVGDLAKGILARNYRAIVAEANSSASEAEIWDILRRIIGEQLGVKIGEVARDTKFAKEREVCWRRLPRAVGPRLLAVSPTDSRQPMPCSLR